MPAAHLGNLREHNDELSDALAQVEITIFWLFSIRFNPHRLNY